MAIDTQSLIAEAESQRLFDGTKGRSMSNNNPLNIEYLDKPGSYQEKYGVTLEPPPKGGSKPHFGKYPNMIAGYQAGIDRIKLSQRNPKTTLRQFVSSFSPSSQNPTEDLIIKYSKALGVTPDTPMKNIPAEQLIVPMLARESSTVLKGTPPLPKEHVMDLIQQAEQQRGVTGNLIQQAPAPAASPQDIANNMNKDIDGLPPRNGAMASPDAPGGTIAPVQGQGQGVANAPAGAPQPGAQTAVEPGKKMGFSEDESWNPHKEQDFTNKYNTQLTPAQEATFQAWAKTTKNAVGGTAINDLYSYDVRGRWLQLEAMSPEERAKATAPGAHGPDTFKKPNHPTFSVESKYSGADGYVGGKWKGDDFIPPSTWKPPTPAQPGAQPVPGLTPDQLAQAAQQGENVANLPPGPAQTLPELAGKIAPVARPILEYGGLAAGGAAGGAIGAAAGIPTGGVVSPVGAVAGAGLGYGLGKKAADALDAYAGKKPMPPPVESMVQSGKDVATGAEMEMAGQAGGVALQAGLKGAGKVASATLGKLGGEGIGGPEEAIRSGKELVGNIFKSQTAYDKALRGEISGQEVVDISQDALQNLRNVRSKEYEGRLANIAKHTQDLDLAPLNIKVRDLMKQYGVTVTPEGKLDVSRVKMGSAGRKDIEEIIDTIWDWGSKPGDKTALGLDGLKRQLDDFYSDSSQARQFVAVLKKEVAKTITKEVPEYAEMTKGYSQATALIKDIESNLLHRKEGMSGRITADQTLRRLTSAMRENFSLRRDLVDTLGAQSGKDIPGLVAGNAMSQLLPRGLMGPITVTEGGLALGKYLSLKIWPILIASSPRAQGEFLRIWGKGLAESAGASLPVAKVMAYLAFMTREGQKPSSEVIDRLKEIGGQGFDALPKLGLFSRPNQENQNQENEEDEAASHVGAIDTELKRREARP